LKFHGKTDMYSTYLSFSDYEVATPPTISDARKGDLYGHIVRGAHESNDSRSAWMKSGRGWSRVQLWDRHPSFERFMTWHKPRGHKDPDEIPVWKGKSQMNAIRR
jgi:hypothetical protein